MHITPSRWLGRAAFAVPWVGLLAACLAETQVNLLEECTTPGDPCGPDRVCSEQLRCVPPEPPMDAFSDAGDPSHEGGMMDLPEGGMWALIGAACSTSAARSSTQPTSLMLVVDVSGSMNELAPGRGTRWDSTHAAIDDTLDALPSTTAVGMLLFPNQHTEESFEPLPSSACVNTDAIVSPAPLGLAGSRQRESLDRALDAVEVGEGTPTHDAYRIARDELEWTAVAGDRHLLLITDGAPTLDLGCVVPDRVNDTIAEGALVDAIARAYDAGTQTFVVGAPGSEQTSEAGEDARPWLSRAASAGGTAKDSCSHAGPAFCHFDMVEEPDFGAALRAALGEIAWELVPCEYDVPDIRDDRAVDRNDIDVVWSPGDGSDKLLLRSTEEDCELGWRYTDDLRHIRLCRESCERLRADSTSGLTLIFGCDIEIIPY